MKKKIIKLIIMLVIEAGLILTVCGVNGVLTEPNMDPQMVVRYVCDGFCVAGGVYLCLAGLFWATNEGVFDGFGYHASMWFNSKAKNKRDWRKKEEFSEYKERQIEKRKGRSNIEFVIVGGAAMVVSLVLLIVYYCAF